MALMKCTECGKEISDKSKKCPNCGFKISENKQLSQKIKKVTIAIITIIFIISIGTLVYNKTKLPELNDKEQQALLHLKDLSIIAEDTDSIEVHSIEWINSSTDIDVANDYYYIDISYSDSKDRLKSDSFIFKGEEMWSYKYDLESTDNGLISPTGMAGFIAQNEGYGEQLDVEKIMKVFNRNK